VSKKGAHVGRALDLAGELGDGDRVDALEQHFDDVTACLCSPRIRSAVNALAHAILNAPGGELSGERVAATIARAIRQPPAGDGASMHPRTIYVRDQ
jgi:hypothetical protein